MTLSSAESLPAPIDRVAELFHSEDFVRRVSEAAGGALVSFRIDGDSTGAFELSVTRTIPTDRLPDFARKVVGTTLNLKQQDSWSAPGPDGSREIRIQASIPGVPVAASAVQRLLPQPGQEQHSTRIELEGFVTSSIPFLGEKIIQAAEPALGKALRLQVSEARTLLQENR